jgi:hypothetical protein
MAYNRQQLLQDFNQYSDEELFKLHTIAKSILNPNLNQLVAVDFASMIDMVFTTGGLADTYFPTWTDRTKSDFGRFLVEIFCLLSDKDFYYINHYSKEAFGPTAELYRSLVHKAISNGFKPPANIAASTTIAVTVGPTSVVEAVPAGAVVFGMPGTDTLNFSNEPFSIPISGTPQVINVVFKHGIIKSLTGNFNGRSMTILDKSVVESSVKLNLNGDTNWSEDTTL